MNIFIYYKLIVLQFNALVEDGHVDWMAEIRFP
jgi:hypothetical protein